MLRVFSEVVETLCSGWFVRNIIFFLPSRRAPTRCRLKYALLMMFDIHNRRFRRKVQIFIARASCGACTLRIFQYPPNRLHYVSDTRGFPVVRDQNNNNYIMNYNIIYCYYDKPTRNRCLNNESAGERYKWSVGTIICWHNNINIYIIAIGVAARRLAPFDLFIVKHTTVDYNNIIILWCILSIN